MYSNMMLVLFSFSIITTLSNMSKKKIIILMNLEMIMIVLMLMITTMMIDSSSFLSNFVTMLMIMVTESVLGLSIMTASSRNSSPSNSISKTWF